MHFLICLSLLLLAPHYSTSTTYSIGTNFIRLLFNTDLSVLNPSSVIQTLDFTEIFVWDADTIFVGAADYILKLNADLVIDRIYEVDYTGMPCVSTSTTYLDSCSNFFRVFLNISDNLYTCFTNRQSDPVCLTLNATTLAVESSPPRFDQVGIVAGGYISPSLPAILLQRNFAIYLLNNAGVPRLVTGSVFDERSRNRITVTNPFETLNRYITTTFYYFEEDSRITEFLNAASFARTAHNYLDTINNNNYIYFMFYEPSNNLLSGTAISRLARFCLEGPSNPDPTVNANDELPQMRTFVKGELECGNVFPLLIQDWLFVESGGDFIYYVVFSSLLKGPQTSYLCTYSLNSIRATMDTVKECNAIDTLVSGSFSPIAGQPLLGYAGALFTQLQRYTFDFNSITYEMIYVSLTNGSIIKYCLSCDPADQLVELIQVVPSDVIASIDPDLSYLDRLQLNGDHLLAGGYTGLYKVPLQSCSLFSDDYISCLGDPMCYFDLNNRLCMAITPSTMTSSSLLHLTRPLPPVATCSLLTGYVVIDTIAMTTNISLSWSCVLADDVDITITFSDGSSDVILMYDNSPTNAAADLPYINLTLSDISSFSIRPFLTRNSIIRALPGTPLLSYVTYDVIEIAPIPSSSCTPLPPICGDPVCVGSSPCTELCSSVRIDCSEEFSNNPCADGIRYTLDGGAFVPAPNPANIVISSTHCGVRGCLFQSFTYNTTASTETLGTSHWLNLLSPFTTYSPVLSVQRSVNSTFSFSADFSEFDSYSCSTPLITTTSISPLTLTNCSETISAVGMVGGDSSSESSIEVFSSQAVLAPTNLQLGFSKKSDRDECSYISDVTVTWQKPAYNITNLPEVRYVIEGSACSLEIGSGITVIANTNYVCNDVILSYYTDYTIYVTSIEPCHERASVAASLVSKTIGAAPGKPQGLGYTFSENYLTLTWSPPLCTNSDGALMYRVIVYRSLCGTNSSELYDDITTANNSHLVSVSNSMYYYDITLHSIATNNLSSENVTQKIFSPVSSSFSCVECRVSRVRIGQRLGSITCESTPACQNLSVTETYVTLTLKTDSLPSPSEVYMRNITGNCTNISLDLSSKLTLSGLYTVSIQHYIKHACSDEECVSEKSKAFYDYNLVDSTAAPQGISLDQICQDDKAFIIVVLAAIAILCAAGNLSFMLVAFCVFCVPRRKLFRC